MKKLYFCQRMALALMIAFGAGSIFANDTSAKVAATQKTTYFTVTGRTTREIRKSIERTRPFFANTHWESDAKWIWKSSGKTCRITSATVFMDLVVQLPRWKPEPGVPASVTRAWSQFSEALAVHENGHVTRYKAAAGNLETALLSLKGPCATIDREARKLSESWFKKFQKINDDYDAETKEGRTQGVRME